MWIRHCIRPRKWSACGFTTFAIQSQQPTIANYQHNALSPTNSIGDTLNADADKYQEGGYLDVTKIPKDPWDHDYIFVCPSVQSGKDYDLESYGKDGEDGGAGDNADIENWNLDQLD